METGQLLKSQFSPTARRFCIILIIFAALLILSGAVCVPFIFESQTLRYQFGLSRKLLLAGHVMGVSAAVLLFFQLTLISRIKIFDRIFAINRLLLQHRINAAVIIFLALSHFTLILYTLGAEVLAGDVRQWPEFTGLFLLVLLTGIVFSGFFRGYTGISFRLWLYLHRVLAPSAILPCLFMYIS